MEKNYDFIIDDKVMLEGEDNGPKNAFEFLEATRGTVIKYKPHTNNQKTNN